MFEMMWPMAVVVCANTLYNICTKSIPDNVNSFLALAITYCIAALICIGLFYVTSDNKDIVKELGKVNWASFALAAAVMGLEIGYVFIYRAGWQISVASLVANIALAIVLVFVGLLAYKESLTFNQIIGVLICVVGLIFLNR